MKRLPAIPPMIPALALMLVGSAAPAWAQEAPAPAAAAVAETVAPIVDKGDTTWMMVSAILVMMMTIPGLALFYGGLVRAKNMLSVLMQVFTVFCIMSLLWVCFGYSLAFTGAGSAEDALGLLRDGVEVDVLVTDHLMPGMSGAELAREARALRPGLPVLVVSGYAEVDGLPADLPRLVKPFRVAELAEQVAELVPGAASTE